MKRFVVLTTPTCTKCKVIKDLVRSNDVLSVEFMDAKTPEGKAFAKQYKIMGAGIITDTQTGQQVTFTDVLAAEL
jgi:hypothetical protein